MKKINNKQITDTIITNNIKGSFIVVLWRESKKNKYDFIDPFRVSVYHHIILKEHDKYTFPDIMEKFTSCDQTEYNLNNLDGVYEEECDYWISSKDIKKYQTTLEEVYNTYVEILENKAMALLYSKNMLYKKLCGYKIMCMKGYNLPIYGMKVVHTRFKKFNLLSGDDILKEKKLTRSFLKHIKPHL